MAASLIFGIQIGCQQTFVALGNAKNSLFLAVLRKLILLIPLIYILPPFFAGQGDGGVPGGACGGHAGGDGYGAAVPGEVRCGHA